MAITEYTRFDPNRQYKHADGDIQAEDDNQVVREPEVTVKPGKLPRALVLGLVLIAAFLIYKYSKNNN